MPSHASTIAERVQWILDHGRARDGATWTAKSLSKAAGLASEAHVGLIRRGVAKRPTGETIARIAAAAGVSARWLLTGQGSAHEDDATPVRPANDPAQEPRMGNTPHWDDLLSTARVLDPGVPEWSFDVVARSHPLATTPLTAGMIVDLARVVMKHVPPPGADGGGPAPRRAPRRR